MEYQNKALIALIMLPLQPRRPILLIPLMMAALMIMTKTELPNWMLSKMPSYTTETKNYLEKMRRSKCLTGYSYDDKRMTLKNSKKNLEKIKRLKCLTSFVKTPTQHNTTVGFDDKMTLQTPPTHPPHTNSMSAISQLLLT